MIIYSHKNHYFFGCVKGNKYIILTEEKMKIVDFFINFSLEIFVGALSIILVLILERQARPNLKIIIDDKHLIPEDDPAKRQPTTWLRVRVENQPMPGIIKWAYIRQPAFDCRATIDFIDPEGKQVFSIPGRWSGNPRPEIIKFLTPENYLAQAIIGEQHTRNIGPSSEIYQGESLDVAIRIKDEENCYAWNNQSYIHDWKNPNYILHPGIWKIIVKIDTGGQVFISKFNLNIGIPYEEFSLSNFFYR
jgi:hypothetical protein